MAEFDGSKWGNPTFGTPGGVVTWSIVDEGREAGKPFRFNAKSKTVNPDIVFDFDVGALIVASFQSWSRAGNIEFVQISDPGLGLGAPALADIRIGFAVLDGPGGVTGIATHPDDGGNIVIESGDIRVADNKILQNVLTHEIGHALGLDHETDVSAILNPVASSKTELEPDDIEGIQTIYGVQDNARPTLRLDDTGRKVTLLQDVEGMRVFGSLAKDNVRGSSGDELLLGRGGDDLLNGGGGDDTVKGAAGNDLTKGGRGADKLFGNAGDDRLIGGAGDDVITGAAGDDTMNGGGGADRFVFKTAFGDDRITRFNAEEDLLDFRRSRDVDDLGDLRIRQKGADVLITDSDGDSLLLTSVSRADLSADDFLF